MTTYPRSTPPSIKNTSWNPPVRTFSKNSEGGPSSLSFAAQFAEMMLRLPESKRRLDVACSFPDLWRQTGIEHIRTNQEELPLKARAGHGKRAPMVAGTRSPPRQRWQVKPHTAGRSISERVG